MDRYRLGPMRDVRALDERVKRGEMATRVDDARGTSSAVEAAQARVATAESALSATTIPPMATAAQLAAVDRHRARLRAARAAAQGELARAEAAHAGSLAEVDAARARLTRARADREVLERHFAAWRAERAKERERRED